MTAQRLCLSFLLCSHLLSAGIAKAKDDSNILSEFKVTTLGLNAEQAKRLVAIVATKQGYPLNDPHFEIERLTDSDGKSSVDPFPGFFYFSLTKQSAQRATINNLKVYYVSKMTGDLWQSLTPSPLRCFRVYFNELANIQNKIMHQTGVTFKSEKFQRMGIGCATR